MKDGQLWKMVMMMAFSLITLIPVSFAQNILVLNEQCEGSIACFPTALTNLGYTFTETNNDAAFYAALTGGTTWDLVIVDEYYYPIPTSIPAIQSYIAGGGKCCMATWQWDSTIAASFEATLGAAYTTVIPQYRWDTGHSLFTSPNSVPDLAPTLDTCIADGAYFEPIGSGVAVAGYTASPTANQASIIIGNSDRTILMGEIPGNFGGDADVDGKADMLELAENVVSFLMKGNENCPGITIPVAMCPGTGITITRTGSTIGADNDIDEATQIACTQGWYTSTPEHVYNFTPPYDMQLQIDLLGSDFDTMLVIANSCPGGETFCMANDDYDGALQSGFGCTTFSAGVTYSIIIFGYESNTGNYVLNITECGSPAACQPCPCFDATFSLTSDYQTVSDSLVEGACNVYAVALTSGWIAEFTFCAGGGSAIFDTVLTLRDAGCNTIASNDDSCGALSEIIYEVTASGMYYLEVASYSGLYSGDYTLAYKNQVVEICPTCPSYNFQITPTDVYQTHSSSIEVGGCKKYQMTLYAGATAIFTFCEGGGSVGYDSYLRLYDSACNLVAQNDDYCGLASHMPYTVPSTGTYYLESHSYGGYSGGNYTIAYQQTLPGTATPTPIPTNTPPAGCQSCPNYDFEIEPVNDYQTHSGSIVVGGCAKYAMALMAGATATFTFCEGGGTGNYDTYLHLYDSSCNILASNDDSCGGLSHISYTIPTTGTYYLEVNSCCTGSSGGSYTLAYRQVIPATPTPTPTLEPTATPTPEPCLHTGDVDFNEVISSGDAQIAFLIGLGSYMPTEDEECAADCNGDGVVSSGDAQIIFMVGLGMVPSCENPL